MASYTLLVDAIPLAVCFCPFKVIPAIAFVDPSSGKTALPAAVDLAPIGGLVQLPAMGALLLMDLFPFLYSHPGSPVALIKLREMILLKLLQLLQQGLPADIPVRVMQPPFFQPPDIGDGVIYQAPQFVFRHR